MNTNNAKQYLPLVQALADGKTVQLKAGGSWIDTTDVEFVAAPERYRIKPEPRVIRVWVNRNTGEVGDKYTGPLPPHSGVLAACEGWYAPEFREVV